LPRGVFDGGAGERHRTGKGRFLAPEGFSRAGERVISSPTRSGESSPDSDAGSQASQGHSPGASGPVRRQLKASPRLMKVFGITGHSGMGKTTLLERLVPQLRSRGLAVSLIKHSHKNIDIDRPGKDSYRLRESGCTEVLLLGNVRWALMHELRDAEEPPLGYLLERMQRCDLVLIEGFKDDDFPKLEVWRAEVGKPTLWPDWPGIVAIASHGALPLPEIIILRKVLTLRLIAFFVSTVAAGTWQSVFSSTPPSESSWPSQACVRFALY
jgi:molybdopterin-guanine dinucleotide biosynthesis protein B